MKETYRVILSHQSNSFKEAKIELQTADGRAEFIESLDPETSLFKTYISFDKLAKVFKNNPPIYIRHICPAAIALPLSGHAHDLAALTANLPELDKSLTFSVQTRILGKNTFEYKPFDINQTLSDALAKKGHMIDVKNPQQVLSVVIAENTAYLGLSFAEENLSSWAGGKRRFAKDEGQISRAEFKLLESLEYFNIAIDENSLVLDLGAAPGGWTRVALERGAKVCAVDPALLDKRLATAKGLTHIKTTAQTFLDEDTRVFDLILNDMRMEPELSAQLMVSFYEKLRSGGVIIMTLKLFGGQTRKQVTKALSKLENYYTIIGARQLFHNRSEVTVVLKK